MKEIITNLALLSEPSEPLTFLTDAGVTKDEGLEIINELKEILSNSKDLVALSAPQIGIKKRIFCIKFNDTIKTFINPIVTKKDKMFISPEVCGSMPGKEILISRPTDITVVYYNDEFKYEDNKLLDFAARIFDQQLQFLDGVTPADLGLVSDVENDGSLFDLKEEEFDELVEIYKKFITAKTSAYTKNITENTELTDNYNHLKFTEDVINGRTQVIVDDPLAKADRLNKKKAEAASSKANFRAFIRRKK